MKNFLSCLIFSTMAFAWSCKTINVEVELDTFIDQYCGAINRNDTVLVKQNTLPFIGIPTALIEMGQINTIEFRLNEREVKSVADNQWEITIPFVWEGEGNKLVINLLKTEKGILVSRFALSLNSEALAVYSRSKIQTDPEILEEEGDFQEALRQAYSLSANFRTQYDSVVYFAKSEGEFYFYVVNGNYIAPDYEKPASGDFLMGVVNQNNDTIIPIEYDKIYNPHIPISGYIIAEKDGMKDLFDLNGQKISNTSFNEIYPYNQNESILAQVKLDSLYGWLGADGSFGFEPKDSLDTNLFSSPIQSDLFSNLEFSIQSDYSYLNLVIDTASQNSDGYYDISTNLLVSPSYLVKLGLMREYMWDLFGLYYGTNEYEVSFTGIKKLWNNLVMLVVDFKEYGLDARGYHYEVNKYIISDKDFNAISQRDFSVGENYSGLEPSEAHFINDSIVEYRTSGYNETHVFDVYMSYFYFQLDSSGTFKEVDCNRSYPFTKYVKIDDSYFVGGYKLINTPEYRYNALSYPYISEEELDIMRNEIFADYGYNFKDEKWANYFSRMDWYSPQYDDVSDLLNEFDKYNVDQILKFKARLTQMNTEPDSILYNEGP